jgi:cyanophycin synthetase
LESFSAQMDKVPARFNVFDIAGATVIVDYGHNPSSLQAILTAMQQFPQQVRTAVYSVAGDRRDCELLGGAFDRVILYEDHYLRGRPQGEIVGLLRSGLAGARRTKEMQAFTVWTEAVDAALRVVQPGELLLIQADVVDQAVNYLKSFLAANVSVNGTSSTAVEVGGTLKSPAFLHVAG